MSGDRLNWSEILSVAAGIVESYDTPVTLRQLHYRLVAADIGYRNARTTYQTLSARTAEARRAGTFPQLMDMTRSVHQPPFFANAADAIRDTLRWYRHDRTAGQPCQVFVGVEKNGLLAQLTGWFGDYGLPVVALGGYASQTLAEDVSGRIADDGRPAVLLYGGDFDPSGEDILRDFLNRCPAFAEVQRVALNAEQVRRYDLPAAIGKATDSRAAGFIERHGKLVQVELDALPPDILRDLYLEALKVYWEPDAFEACKASEAEQRARLAAVQVGT